MKNVLLIPIGSSGDVHPFIAIGREMKTRGHEVTVATNGFFRGPVEKAGLNFIEFGMREEYIETTENPDLWHPRKSFPLIMGAVARALEPMFNLIKEHQAKGDAIVACGSLAFGARVAQEKLGVPTAMIHLQPGVFRSETDPPVLPALTLPSWFPPLAIRGVYRLIDVAVDRELGRPLNIFRKTVGLRPISRVMGDWWHSPQLTIGLFPEWFYPIQKTWPSSIKLTGFPVFDGEGVENSSSGVEEFFNSGEPPIVFTGGSAMMNDRDFFAESAKACVDLGKRGVLVAQFKDQIPTDLPSSVKHFSYVPFGRIFPRAAAIVHHGGVGTMAQGFKSGRPQLVKPLAHDQFDNAKRVKKLGVGLEIDSKKYKAKNVTPLLHRLITEPSFSEAAARLAPLIDGTRDIRRTCDLIEKL